MEIVVLGAGVIGTTYALAWQAAGHRVCHLVRPERREGYPRRLRVELLDGRARPPSRSGRDLELVAALEVDLATADLAFISVPG